MIFKIEEIGASLVLVDADGDSIVIRTQEKTAPKRGLDGAGNEIRTRDIQLGKRPSAVNAGIDATSCEAKSPETDASDRIETPPADDVGDDAEPPEHGRPDSKKSRVVLNWCQFEPADAWAGAATWRAFAMGGAS